MCMQRDHICTVKMLQLMSRGYGKTRIIFLQLVTFAARSKRRSLWNSEVHVVTESKIGGGQG